MLKPILTIPKDDKFLRQKSDEVISFDKSVETVINDLTDTLESQKDPVGLGLSAPQIGILKRIFVARVRNKIKAFVNPKIIKFSKKEASYLEGCFSVPELYGHVMRPAEIDLAAQDKQGKKSQNHYKGLPARIIQHEVDHLNGTLFVDHIHDQNGKVLKVEKNKKGKEEFVEVPLA